ncbi:hypothetical protein DRQ50_13150, partial [bacterium]
MMQQHIDRSRQTRGGMTASFVLHAGLLFLLTVMVGGQAARTMMDNELTEIAYIEARYGEDVAAKVKMREKPRRPEPPGRGVATDSAMKPAEPESPASPRPEPKPLTQTRMELPETAVRQEMAVTDIATPEIAPKVQHQALAEAATLEAKAPRPANRRVIDASKLQGVLSANLADNSGTPARVTSRPTGKFKPSSGALQSKAGGVVTGGDIVAAPGSSRSTGVTDAPAAVGSGGGLSSNSRGTYQTPGSSLAPTGDGGGKAGGKGVLDVTGPTGGGGSGTSGRKTILNYGSGGGGRGGGGLAGRARIAEPEPTAEIVKTAAEPAPQKAVAEVKLDDKGVGMTISGQIQGRKILKSVAPKYTVLAR